MPRDRPRLWDTFKRALGSPTPSNEAEPEKARPSDYAPPFLPPDEPDQILPATAADPPSTPFDRNPPAAQPPRAEGSLPIVAAATEDRPGPTPATRASEEAGSAPRLARGLASFSRDNADREKKFRHILSDEGSAKSKKP